MSTRSGPPERGLETELNGAVVETGRAMITNLNPIFNVNVVSRGLFLGNSYRNRFYHYEVPPRNMSSKIVLLRRCGASRNVHI